MTRHLRQLRARLTYANVVATLALSVALGTGGAYAASQLGRNTVGHAQLKKNAVGSRAIKNGSIAARDLSKAVRDGQVKVDTAKVTSDGALDSGTAKSAVMDQPDHYTVTFDRAVSNCTYSATPATVSITDTAPPAASARITGQGTGPGGTQLSISTYDATGTAAPSGFHLIVVC